MNPSAGMSLLNGRYRLRRRLGAGGMAAVWLARDERLGRMVAVKVMAEAPSADARWFERFEREARAAAAISHPNVVRVFDFGIEDGRPYLVMEYAAGADLAACLADAEMSAPEPVAVARGLLAALDAVHAAGIVHRDVKPANVVLDAYGQARLTDFGIAQPGDATSLTQTGMIVGTLKYLAPEVATGEPATARSDLYAAGLVIRELVGARPAPELAPLIAALTPSDPEQRPGSAKDALALIDAPRSDARAGAVRSTATTRAAAAPRATGGAPITGAAVARRPSSPTAGVRRTSRSTRSRHSIVPAIAAAIVVALIILVAASRDGGEPRSSPQPAPAAADAPLDEQLRALDRIVTRAAGR